LFVVRAVVVGPTAPADSILPPVLGWYTNTSPIVSWKAQPPELPALPLPPLLLVFEAKVTGGGGGDANIGAAGDAALGVCCRVADSRH
jgi:hypothetical protein